MNKKIVVLGGGTGQSGLLSGLKEFPYDITAIVSVADDGTSTGKLRDDFNIPAVGDVRRVVIALSETESIVEKLFDYRFNGDNNFSGHSLGNILLAALCDINGSLSKGVKSISNLLNLKGNVLPLTDDSVTLVGIMEDDSIVSGESNITKSKKKVKSIYYKEKPSLNKEVIKAIKSSDAIIISMGSVYTSIICNLICEEIIQAIDESNAKVIYVCNIMTQPGESDGFKVSDHVNLINEYLGKHKIDLVICNIGKIDENAIYNYATQEQKDPVMLDRENISCDLIAEDLVCLDNNLIRHNPIKLAYEIYGYLIDLK